MTEDDGKGKQRPASIRRRVMASFVIRDFNDSVNAFSADDPGYATVDDTYGGLPSPGNHNVSPHRNSVSAVVNPLFDNAETTFGWSDVGPEPEIYEYGAAGPQYDTPVAIVSMRRSKSKSSGNRIDTAPDTAPKVVYTAGTPIAPPRSSVMYNPGFRPHSAVYRQSDRSRGGDQDGVDTSGMYEMPVAAGNVVYEEPGVTYAQPEASYEVATGVEEGPVYETTD